MKPGDTVTVQGTGRRARIVEERGGGYYAIEYLPDQASDPMDRGLSMSGDEAGMYREGDLELAE